MIAVIDYDTGNIRNLIKALDYVGLESQLTADPAEILARMGSSYRESGHLRRQWRPLISEI